MSARRSGSHLRKPSRARGRSAWRVAGGVGLAALPAMVVLHVMGCGARSELLAPEGVDLGCTETQTAAVTASIGGGIHHIYTECMARPDGGACPSGDDALESLQPTQCFSVDEVLCGPIVKPALCCYVVLETCGLT